ncbi:E3 ubiquitin-protein ligase TRIM32-like [Frankliniella occidentalis]|uniref:E3 ubiquitin-protein ligase TRIM32-like n=1 Tax=Frankliniella occidentalis TaxID=133901 RepID=A0A6J1T2H2_FRAOC|nr:E3 ubiquitin-protein ligase TRIM32-like [Frankliniella occidentalis]XP_052126096.1 E3 ubiquitin-protein ligase TRIM32-like [Frankliniella occidentalis]
MDLECDICTERFDGAERLPKVLPCGHTACLQCMRRLPDSSCPTCRQDFIGPPEGLPANFLALRMLEGVRQDRTPRCWCSDCRTAPSPRCYGEVHNVLYVKSALRRQLQDALPQAAEQLQGLEDQCRDEQALPALTLLTGESWDVTLRGGGRELTGTLRTSEEPLTKALCLLLAARAALTEDQGAARERPPAAAPTPPAAAPSPAAAVSTPAADPLAARDPPPAEALPPREIDVRSISGSGPGDNQQQKAALLLDAPGVTRLVEVYCYADPAWSLQLLQRAAPTLERLSVSCLREAHLRAVHAMPRLRRLFVDGNDAALDARPPELPALPPGHAGLQWLRVCLLPRATTQSLLRAHGGTLEELELWVGTAGSDGWPYSCGDLHSLLQQSGLRALRRLVLRRGYGHEAAACSEQRAEVRRVLPGAEVLCDTCDRVEDEEV